MSNEQLTMTGLPKKYDKIIKQLPEFKDIADAASVDDLKKIIVESEGNIFTVEKEQEEDQKLAGAKEIVKDMAAGYKDAKNVLTAKIKYAIHLLEGKGVNIDTRDEE